MVRRSLIAVAACALVLAAAGCQREADMPEKVEMPDTATIMRAMSDAEARDSMMDTIPGGEMARGDSTAEMRLLKKKM
jgi:hypothetical protein